MSSMRRIRIGIIGLAAVLIAGTIGFNQAEGKDLFTSFYFTVIALTTVGFGDVVPVTVEGRIVALSILFRPANTLSASTKYFCRKT